MNVNCVSTLESKLKFETFGALTFKMKIKISVFWLEVPLSGTEEAVR